MLRSFALPLLTTLTLVNCSDGSARPDYLSGEDTASLDPVLGGTASTIASRGSYPSGPYGAGNPEVGDVVPNLSLLGFVNLSGTEGGAGESVQTVTLQDIRKTGRSYVVMHVSAFWCASCRGALRDLTDHTDAIDDAGGIVLELLVDGEAKGAEPSLAQLDLWLEAGSEKITTVGPGDDLTARVFPDLEHAYIIDLDTMEVVWHEEGLYAAPTIGEEVAKAALDDWLR